MYGVFYSGVEGHRDWGAWGWLNVLDALVEEVLIVDSSTSLSVYFWCEWGEGVVLFSWKSACAWLYHGGGPRILWGSVVL